MLRTRAPKYINIKEKIPRSASIELIYVCIRMRARARINIYSTQKIKNVYIRIRTYTYIRERVHACMRMHIYACMRARARARVHGRISI